MYEIDEKQMLRSELEFYLVEELNKVMKNDKQLNVLQGELDKEVIYKKIGSYVDKQESYEPMKKRIVKRQEQIKRDVYSKYFPGLEILADIDYVSDSDFDKMKSSEAVLKEAFDDYWDSLLSIPKIELPDIDINAAIEQFKLRNFANLSIYYMILGT